MKTTVSRVKSVGPNFQYGGKNRRGSKSEQLPRKKLLDFVASVPSPSLGTLEENGNFLGVPKVFEFPSESAMSTPLMVSPGFYNYLLTFSIYQNTGRVGRSTAALKLNWNKNILSILSLA